MKMSKEELAEKRVINKRYREKHLNKDKKFFSIRVSRDEGNGMKEFMKQYGISIKKIIDEGTEIMWKEIQ